MKTVRLFSVIAIAALAFVGCEKNIEVAVVPVTDAGIVIGQEITVSATTDTQPASKTVLMQNNEVWWMPSDQITVLHQDCRGLFETEITAPAVKANFTGTLNHELETPAGDPNCVYGIFPASNLVSVKIDNNEDTLVEAPFKYSQRAVDGSFDPQALLSIARSVDLTLSFRTAVSVLALKVEDDGVTQIMAENIDKSLGAIGAETVTMRLNNDGEPVLWGAANQTHFVTLDPPEGQQTFTKGNTYYMVVLPGTYKDGVKFTLSTAGDPIEIYLATTLTANRNKIHPVDLKHTEMDIQTVWLRQSGAAAWNEYYGGAPGTDRNIAMDDKYVYIAEAAATPKLWAISIDDDDVVKEVNITGVSGGVFPLACPRVVKNLDWRINNGEDVLICSNLTRGGEDPKLYVWDKGIDQAPTLVELVTYATGAWYGDTFTVYGNMQNGILFFDKTGGDGENGIITFDLDGKLTKKYLHKRLVFGSEGAPAAYYPFPYDVNNGVYSPGRGKEARGQALTFEGDLSSEGNSAFTPTLTPLEYAEGRNGFVLAYNFIKWADHRYVIYGKQPNNKQGFVYVLEGNKDDNWLDIVNNAPVKYRRDLFAEDGSAFVSANSGMDVTARVIHGQLYFAAQKQGVACGLYKLVFKY